MEDTRASSVEKTVDVVLSENPDNATKSENSDKPEAPIQPQLTPEQLAELALKNKTIDEFMQSLGSYVLIQFARPDSVIARVVYSDQQPYPPTVIAVLEHIVRDLKLREEVESQSDMMENAAKQAQAAISENSKSRTVRDRILGRR